MYDRNPNPLHSEMGFVANYNPGVFESRLGADGVPIDVLLGKSPFFVLTGRLMGDGV